jgi:hypothetical protein
MFALDANHRHVWRFIPAFRTCFHFPPQFAAIANPNGTKVKSSLSDATGEAKEQIMANNEISVAIKADASEVKPAINDAKQGMADLATQIAGATQQFSAGVTPMTVFSDHANGVFSAISKVSGVTTGFIGFMGGPWGVVLTSAVSILSSLWEGHQKAAEKEGTHRSTAQELNAALSDLDKITGHGNKTTEQSVRDSEQAAQATYNHTIQIRENTRAKLAQMIAMQNALFAGAQSGEPGSDGASIALAVNEGQLADLKKQLADEDKAIAQMPNVMRGAKSFTIMRGVDDEFDKATAAAHRFESAVADLRAKYEDPHSGMSDADFTAQYRKLEQERIAAQKTGSSKPIQTSNPIRSTSSGPAASSLSVSASDTPSNDKDAPVHISGDFSQPLELSPGSKDKFVADIKSTFQNVGKVIGTTADDQKAKWKSVADSISSAFASSLQGMIKGTQNFRGMMLNIGNAILGEATKWIQKKVSAFLTGELAQTAATTTGVTTRTGIEAIGAATSQGISATNSLMQIGHSAAVAAAGAYAAIAKIPIVGPVLAPIAAAAALAGVIALGKSIFSAEGGMGQVPYDGAMFELHKDEMVLPASLATPMRSMLLNPAANNNAASYSANDGGVTHNHFYDIKAMDGQDVHRVLMRHHTSVARAANKAYRYGYKPA